MQSNMINVHSVSFAPEAERLPTLSGEGLPPLEIVSKVEDAVNIISPTQPMFSTQEMMDAFPLSLPNSEDVVRAGEALKALEDKGEQMISELIAKEVPTTVVPPTTVDLSTPTKNVDQQLSSVGAPKKLKLDKSSSTTNIPLVIVDDSDTDDDAVYEKITKQSFVNEGGIVRFQSDSKTGEIPLPSGTNNRNAQGARWCFTWNNYPKDAMEKCEELKSKHNARYVIVGKEKAPGTGTPHLQGFVIFLANKRIGGVKKLLANDVHWERAVMSSEININYCSKDGDFQEFGERPSFKALSEIVKDDYEEAWELAKKGEFGAIKANIRITHYSSLLKIYGQHGESPGDAPNVTGLWIQGPAGCGKSRKARELYPNGYFHNCSKWGDGVQNTKQAWIIDDFDKNHACLGHHLKIWADRYAFISEVKGGSMLVRPERVVITSQYRIDEIWLDEETREALHRRFEVIDMFPPQMYPIFNPPPVNNDQKENLSSVLNAFQMNNL